MDYTDPSQGSWQFMAVEVEGWQYLFLPQVMVEYLEGPETGDGLIQDDWTIEQDDEQRVEPPNDDDDDQDPPERIFLYNHLHDYESVWWVVVWFVCHCKPDGVADEVMGRVRYEVYKNRTLTFATSMIVQVFKSLPPVLQPLGQVLVKMRDALVYAYRSFEESFDASKMLLVFHRLRSCLKALVAKSRGLDVKPPVTTRRLQEAEWFNAVELEGG